MFLNPNTTETHLLGGKGAALARLGAMGFDVPPWFAIPPDSAFTPSELQDRVDALGAGPFAVRSSGLAEDGEGHSFAGQFDSYLEISSTQVFGKIAQVRASAETEAIRAYCREHGLPKPAAPTVLVQHMIAPRCAGVAFSADPVSGRRGVAVVSATEGTGEKLVSGEVDGETWRIDREGKFVEKSSGKLLSEADVKLISTLARDCETASGRPQDIEWAIDSESGKIWLLQSRPITTLGKLPDPDDSLFVWDNSNIAESYGGVTTPLTFSFARRVYESVYREFCSLMSVPRRRIERADSVFPQMLGLIDGRVYYNLVSWYEVLALLPGFQTNRAFMEQMMGVREPLPDEIVSRIVSENQEGKWKDGMALAKTCIGLITQLVMLPRQISRFQERLDTALAAPSIPLPSMRGDELVAHYRDLEKQLLKRWDAPLVNDFFAMIFYGALRSICEKWLKDQDGTLQNQLLLDCGEIISAEPPRRILAMADIVRKIPDLPALLADPNVPPPEKLRAINAQPDLALAFEKYLEDFGDRCLEELKLESPTVRDDPSSLLSSIGAMAMRESPETKPHPEVPIPKIENPIKNAIFNFVLRQAKTRVRARENLRFERTRVFGRVRAIVTQLGRRLSADGILETHGDVFYLELGEILSHWDATGSSSDLGAIANLRKSEFHAYEAASPPPDRFTSRGPVSRYEVHSSSTPEETNEPSLKGSGACPGRVKGRVRVVLDPRGALLEPGEILVARQTDPGWVVLFPAAAGLLVERGSLLSHSAIVSRELRLPCIVSLPGITRTLKTGDLVEMDGATGAVTIIES